MKHAFFLAYHYLLSTKFRFAVLVLCTALALSLPINTAFAVKLLSAKLTERGERTPILIGKKGNEFALTMNALYFRGTVKETTEMSVFYDLVDNSEGMVLPLYISHSASQTPIVGSNIDYVDARGLTLSAGRYFTGLGEVVMGHQAAQDFNLSVGDTIRSDLKNLYNLAGSYPMSLTVVGILEPSGTADDGIVLADLKTVWALDGLLHGHEQVTSNNALNGDSTDENLEATAAIFMFAELTEKNRDTFHLHGTERTMPLSSVAVFPIDQLEQDVLLGRLALSDSLQAIQPIEVVDDILSIVLKLQQGLYVYFGMLLVSTAFFYVLVVHLSLQLRQRELTLIRRIGGSKRTMRRLIVAETSIVTVTSLFVTGALSLSFIWLIRFGLNQMGG